MVLFLLLAKTMYAAGMMAKLVTIPRPMATHSPFFDSGLALSYVVHLTFWPLFVNDGSASGAHIADVTKKAGLSYYKCPERLYTPSVPGSGNINLLAEQARCSSPASSQSSHSARCPSDGQQRTKDKIKLQVGVTPKTWQNLAQRGEAYGKRQARQSTSVFLEQGEADGGFPGESKWACDRRAGARSNVQRRSGRFPLE